MRKPRRLSTASRAIAQTKIIIVLVLVLILALIIFLKRSRRAEEEGTRGAPSQAAARAAATPAKVPTGKTHAADQILPATTYFLLTAPDLKSAVEQYKKTALCEIVNDPAMKESLAHLFDSIDELKAKVDVQ